MTEQGQKQSAEDRAKQPSDTIEDLQPREDESGGVKGGSFSWGKAGGGAAGKG